MIFILATALLTSSNLTILGLQLFFLQNVVFLGKEKSLLKFALLHNLFKRNTAWLMPRIHVGHSSSSLPSQLRFPAPGSLLPFPSGKLHMQSHSQGKPSAKFTAASKPPSDWEFTFTKTREDGEENERKPVTGHWGASASRSVIALSCPCCRLHPCVCCWGCSLTHTERIKSD